MLDGATIDIFSATIFDNRYLTDEVRENYIKAFKGTADENARLKGQFVRKSGLLYPMFDRGIHIKKYDDTFIKEKWGVIRAIDPHPQLQIHVLWFAVNPVGGGAIVDELICPENANITTCANLIKAKETQFNMILGVIDTLGNTKQLGKEENLTITQQFAQEEVYSKNAQKDFDSGYALCVKAFQGVDIVNRKTGQKEKFYKFHIYDNCIELIYELAHVTWDGASKSEKDPPEKQKKFRDHMVDLMRYLIKEFPYFGEVQTHSPKCFFGGAGR